MVHRSIGVARNKIILPTVPNSLSNIRNAEKPRKADVISAHRSRFQNPTLTLSMLYVYIFVNNPLFN